MLGPVYVMGGVSICEHHWAHGAEAFGPDGAPMLHWRRHIVPWNEVRD